MPGIVGLITRMPRESAERRLSRMIAALRHEDFYVSGSWADESLGVYVGWVASNGSFSEGMPLQNERGDVVLVFSGEEYPEPGTAARLKARGHQLGSNAAEYLVHLYEEGSSFPACLNGRFHGLVVDKTRRTAILFNDRYGMQRVNCHQSDEAFYFAVEAKAILAVRPDLRRIDPAALGEFVACDAVLENKTLFAGVQLLPPGSAWTFRNGALDSKTEYFHRREWEEQEKLDPESAYQAVREAFTANLPRYFDGPQRVTMSLTGGLDTRMIMAWHRGGPGSLPCYTFGGMLRDCRDVTVARRVAQVCGQTHETIRAGEEFLAQFPRYAERAVYLTDGCLNVAHCPDLYISERVRKTIAPVRMTGNYGGEVLRRIRAFKPAEPLPGLFDGALMPAVRRASETYSNLVSAHPVSFSVFMQGPWHHHSVLSLEQTQLFLRSPFLDNDFVQSVFRCPESMLHANDVSLRLIADGNPALSAIPTDRGVPCDGGHFWSPAYRNLLEFSFRAEYACDMGMPQWLARFDHAFAPLHFERLFLGRHKTFHFRLWYRDALAGYVEEMLLDSRSLSRPYLNRNTVESIVRGHLKGNRNYTIEISRLLTLELIHRLFIDDRGPGDFEENSEFARPAIQVQ